MEVKDEICDMQILIIAATEAEIQPLIDVDAGFDVLITGVGIPATMYHLQKRMLQIDYDLVIQAGIAGSFNPDIELGKTVLVKQDCFADLGIEEKGIYTPFFETALADKNEFPFNKGWLINSNEILRSSSLPLVDAISVNTISDNEEQKQKFIKHFNADIESMEGAALHYVCLQEDIPFIQVRAISNYVGERNKSNWRLKKAIENLNKELTVFIQQLT